MGFKKNMSQGSKFRYVRFHIPCQHVLGIVGTLVPEYLWDAKLVIASSAYEVVFRFISIVTSTECLKNISNLSEPLY